MCTVITVNGSFDRSKLIARVKNDERMNSHGFACLTVNKGEYSLIRGMDYSVMYNMLKESKFDRVWIHTRFATQGVHSLANCHGWSTNGIIVMHNGFIGGKEADKKAVDSMAIGEWIKRGGIDKAMVNLRKHSYANVFLIDTVTGEYHVHRSKSGSLFTDGLGNYSTNEVEKIESNVPEYCFRTIKVNSQKAYASALGPYYGKGWQSESRKGYSTWDTFDDEKPVGNFVAGGKHGYRSFKRQKAVKSEAGSVKTVQAGKDTPQTAMASVSLIK